MKSVDTGTDRPFQLVLNMYFVQETHGAREVGRLAPGQKTVLQRGEQPDINPKEVVCLHVTRLEKCTLRSILAF
jgi:hypothetical protein